jgi:hypothetical protein
MRSVSSPSRSPKLRAFIAPYTTQQRGIKVEATTTMFTKLKNADRDIAVAAFMTDRINGVAPVPNRSVRLS